MALRVLQLCAVDFTVKNFLRPLILFLKEQGFDVTIACSPGPFFPELEKEGLSLVSLPISRSMHLPRHLKSTMQLYRYLKRNRFDIVHVHTPIASLIGRLAARLAGVPIKIYTAHGFYFHDEMPPAKRLFHIMLERMAGRWSDFIFTQSEEDRITAIQKKIARPDRIITIGNGVNLERFDPERISREEKANRRQEFHIPPDAPIVGIMGRMVREKGYMEFIEAAALILREIPQTHFLCIGDELQSDYDASKTLFRNRIHDLGLQDRIHFAGMRSDIPELLSILNVYTLPSYREGMPRSIIEAMGMGLPVVATRIRGCREEVADGGTGYLVPPRDADALAESVLELLRAPDRAKAMGSSGRERALALFSEKIVLQRQLEIYEKLIREKGLEARR
jgi:glycosyltransferase involved in cell wall biosynthesis